MHEAARNYNEKSILEISKSPLASENYSNQSIGKIPNASKNCRLTRQQFRSIKWSKGQFRGFEQLANFRHFANEQAIDAMYATELNTGGERGSS